ncbi:FAD:protein FMN transferase [Sphingobium aromaticiconvertens]|uniref:FAD:protein FMN transferase n=1 Tax=Sphingobium aromaticiconvertens TaxID=365341 RepID=UPI00301A24F1
MGTSWSAQLVDPPSDCLEAIEAVLARVIAQMSNWEVASDISRFNRTLAGEWVALPEDLMTVMRAGLDMARISDGAFDPAIGHAVEAWGFGPSQRIGTAPVAPVAPPWRTIELADGEARRLRDVALDLSGIAKGFAVDAIADALTAMGIVSFLVEIGGELRGAGVKPDMQPWWVDLESPPGLALPVLRVALCGLSVATSGDYRRFRPSADGRLSHSIDPASGAPIANDVASVSVLHPQAMLADAWATAITVLGPDRGMALATREGLAALLIRREGARGREYMTPALAAMLD